MSKRGFLQAIPRVCPTSFPPDDAASPSPSCCPFNIWGTLYFVVAVQDHTLRVRRVVHEEQSESNLLLEGALNVIREEAQCFQLVVGDACYLLAQQWNRVVPQQHRARYTSLSGQTATASGLKPPPTPICVHRQQWGEPPPQRTAATMHR